MVMRPSGKITTGRPDSISRALHRHRIGGIHRQVIAQMQHKPEKPVAGHLGVHHEYRIDREECPQDQAVEEGLMVGDDEQPRLRKVARVPFDSDAKQHLQQRSDDGLEHGGYLRTS